MTKGKGTLTDLERLKAIFGPRFRKAAPKRKRINQECFDLLCPHAIGRVGLDRGGRLRIKRQWCSRKRCPKEKE